LLTAQTLWSIEPSSERKKGRSEKTEEDKKSSLIQSLDHHNSRVDWHKNQLKKHTTMANDIEKKIKSIDDIVLTEEELEETRKETAVEMQILQSGGDADPDLITPKEALMIGLGEQIVQEEVDISLSNPDDYKDTFVETRTRYDFDFQIAEIKIHVEKGQDSSGNIKSGSTKHIGPPNFQVTWGFLANITILSTQYAIPFERLGRLLSTPEKTFSSSHMCRYFSYVAKQLLPIYLHLSKQLANSDLISGDDTTVKVIEVANAMEENKKPWVHYSTMESAEKTLEQNPDIMELGPRISAELGFESQKKVGEGSKKQIHTTVVIGKETEDPSSYIIFYRTHLGSFGNLLDTILLQRTQSKNDLFIQSDLSTTNLITDPILLKKLNITLFGCASHARRPFAIYEKDDPAICSHILTLFRVLYFNEKGLDKFGRNQTNVPEMRKTFEKKYWDTILELCHKLTLKWSKSTPLGKAAWYVINHFKKLTAYIDHAFVPLTNDLSERMLRMEKIIQANSLFRTSLEGRFALDICRTIVQTAVAAGINIKDYLLYVLKQDDLQENPAQYTPYFFAKRSQ